MSSQLQLQPEWHTHEGTLSRDLEILGHGLHTGKRVNVRIRPAYSHQGILFRRMQSGKVQAELPAITAMRLGQPLCTALESQDGWRVRTIEHLLAALLISGIDHATVELDAEEVPILDGSALPWLCLLAEAGRQETGQPRRFIEILKPVQVQDGEGRSLRLEPCHDYAIDIRNDLRGFGDLHWEGIITPRSFTEEIAAARSYGRLKWAIPAIISGYLSGRPILRGARPSCTATIWGNQVLGGMRKPQEFVRHRVIDLVGDLALLGAPILGKVIAIRPCHEMNFKLAKTLQEQTDCWRWNHHPMSRESISQ